MKMTTTDHKDNDNNKDNCNYLLKQQLRHDNKNWKHCCPIWLAIQHRMIFSKESNKKQ